MIFPQLALWEVVICDGVFGRLNSALQCIPYFRERHKILHILCIRVRECESILDQSGCICPDSPCISRGYDLHHQYIQYLFQHLCISLNLRIGISISDDAERKPEHLSIR